MASHPRALRRRVRRAAPVRHSAFVPHSWEGALAPPRSRPPRLPILLASSLLAAAIAAHAIALPAAASDVIAPPAPLAPVDGADGPGRPRPSSQSGPTAALSIAATGAAAPAFAGAAFSAQALTTLEAAGPGTLSAVAAYLDRTNRQLLSAEAGAVTGPDRVELLLVGSGLGCASCRPRWTAVWDLAFQSPLWATPDGDGSGTAAAIAGNGIGFTRTDAVWRPGDAGCCPSDWETRHLAWDGTAFTDATNRTG